MIATTKKLPIFTYYAQVIKVIDGDTIDFRVDLGFNVLRDIRVRLLGLNAPELRGESRQAGEASKQAVQDWLCDHDNLVVSTWKTRKEQVDHFGRYLAIVRGDSPKGQQQTLNHYLVQSRLAARYMDEGLPQDFDIPE